jgi:hypothetical protein
MATTPTLLEVLDAIGVSHGRFRGWEKRKLVDDQLSTTQGKARTMTREAALSLALLRFLVDSNVPAEEAAAKASEFAKDVASSRNPRPHWFYSVGADEEPLRLATNNIPRQQIEDMFDIREGHVVGDEGLTADEREFGRLIRRATVVYIPMGEIVRIVDKLFAR